MFLVMGYWLLVIDSKGVAKAIVKLSVIAKHLGTNATPLHKGQMTNDKGQMTNDKGQMTNDKGQMTNDN